MSIFKLNPYQFNPFLLFQMIYPSTCLACEQEIALMCPLCIQEIDWITINTCQICGLFDVFNTEDCPRCISHPLNHQLSLAIIPYHHPTSKYLTQVKYQKNASFSDFYRLLDFCHLRLSQSIFLSRFPNQITDIISMPTQAKRLWQRGVSIPHLFAKSIQTLAPFNKAKYHTNLLNLTRAQGQQVHLNVQERWSAQEGLYQINLGKMPKNPRSLEDRFLLLVDDVSTTGSTFFHAVEACVQAGFRRDQIFTLSIFGSVSPQSSS